jgi:SAM-dependent methyltransferase
MSPADDPVAQQYQTYPYPARDPAEERRRLITGSPSHLAEIRHYLYAGRLDPARHGFRALVAGGGTGDAAIMLAQQLADAGGGEVVYLDLSERARAIAERRAEVRGLTNIAFHTASLLDLPALGLGDFDYVDCCGVLHHLDDPEAGVRALRAVLKDGGGIGLMVYAPYGRTGVYPMQEMLHRLGGDRPLSERVGQARRLWAALPASNWLKRNPFVGDHKRSDAELVDLLLHARDRPYTVAELTDLLAQGGLRPAALIEPARYDPASYLTDPQLLRPLDGADWLTRAGFAETLAGNLKKHVAYAVPAARPDPVAAPDDLALVPVPHGLDAADLARRMGRDPVLTANFDGLKLRFPLPRRAPAMLRRIDGATPVGAILDTLQADDPRLDRAQALAEWRRSYAAFNGTNTLLLRAP